MRKNTKKRSLVIAISVVGILVIALVVFFIIRAVASPSKDPYIQNSSTDSSSSQSDKKSEDTPAARQSPEAKPDSTTSPSVDKASLTTVDIAPMNITVSYVKGVGGFEYQVLRAQNGTQYVQFTNADLVGTKCTNDSGAFASIIANPTEADKATLAKTTKLGDEEYGLSLADSSCAPDTAKLQKYQQSFSDGFSELKKLN